MDRLLFHGYCWGTAAWYAMRGGCRVYDPKMVVGWFRPPSQRHMLPNDLEIYNVKTDGWGLLTLAGVLISISSAVPWPSRPLELPSNEWGDSISSTDDEDEHEQPPAEISKRVGNAIVAVTMFHHVTTMIGAYDFYRRDTHTSTSMAIGVYANLFLTGVGALTFFWGDSGYGRKRPRKANLNGKTVTTK